jgi:hypothetical protein
MLYPVHLVATQVYLVQDLLPLQLSVEVAERQVIRLGLPATADPAVEDHPVAMQVVKVYIQDQLT